MSGAVNPCVGGAGTGRAFLLLVVLFILLIIVGTAFYPSRCCPSYYPCC